jgi:hypothetical protein
MKIFNWKWVVSIITLFLLSACGQITLGETNFIVSFFALVGAWYLFWPITIILVLIISWCTDDNDSHPLAAIISLSIFIFIVQGTQNIELFTFVKENIFLSFAYILAYAAIGTVWSFIKLYFHGIKIKDKHNEQKENFLRYNNNDESKWIKQLDEHIKPNFLNAKPRIKTWIAYWPFSVFWFFAHDIINRICNTIYKLLKNSYQKVFNSAISDVLADYEKVKTINNQNLKTKNAKHNQHNENEDEDV